MKRIVAYTLFGLGFLTVTFFRRYSGETIGHPFIFWLLGAFMFFGGLLFLRYTPTTKEINLHKQLQKEISDLKNNGEKIQVDLLQCDIKENNYIEERNMYGHENPLLTFDFERQIQDTKQVEVDQTVLVYEYKNNRTGKMEKFISQVIPKDRVTLSFYLDRQKQTTLFVDKVDRTRYYFDLEFLQ